MRGRREGGRRRLKGLCCRQRLELHVLRKRKWCCRLRLSLHGWKWCCRQGIELHVRLAIRKWCCLPKLELHVPQKLCSLPMHASPLRSVLQHVMRCCRLHRLDLHAHFRNRCCRPHRFELHVPQHHLTRLDLHPLHLSMRCCRLGNASGCCST